MRVVIYKEICFEYKMESKSELAVDDLPDPDLKIILLGDSAVGKSKLIERYLMDEYNPRQVLIDN